MKTITLFFAGALSIAAFSQRALAQDLPDGFIHSYEQHTIVTTKPEPQPWSILGQWHYAGANWRGLIDIRDDGTFSRVGDGLAGKWKLAAEGDHFALVLKWDHNAAVTVRLMSPTLFQGETAKGDIFVRRLPELSALPPIIIDPQDPLKGAVDGQLFLAF